MPGNSGILIRSHAREQPDSYCRAELTSWLGSDQHKLEDIEKAKSGKPHALTSFQERGGAGGTQDKEIPT